MGEDLGINVNEEIKSKDSFGEKVVKGIGGLAGTLHLTKVENCGRIVSAGWQLSKETQLPVVIVIRANK